MSEEKTVAVVTLGGTIACTWDHYLGAVPSTDRGHMVSVLREASRASTGLPKVHLVQTAPVASADVDTAFLTSIVAESLDRLVRGGMSGAVVTTGTDTLEEVAFVLDLLWRHPEPLVVTGAMRHDGLPGADGAANLRDALRVAADGQARGLGCLVVLDGNVHQAWQVRKGHTSSLAAFESSASGPVGSVFEDTVRITSSTVIDRPLFALSPAVVAPPVALITASLADDGRLLGAVADLGYRALVVETMGGGSVPPSWSPLLERLTAVMPVVYSSRAGRGPTLRCTYGGPGGERDLRRMGMLPAGLLDGLKARLLLGLLLGAGVERSAIEHAWRLFDVPRTGAGRYELNSLRR